MKLGKVCKGIASALTVATFMIGAARAGEVPTTMVWTAYDFGSTGYAQASGIANAFQQELGTRVRIVPSGTGVGRMQMVAQRKAQYGFFSNEALFASEGTEEFAAPQWGPQNLRIVLAPPSYVGIIVPKDSKFIEPKNMAGMRLGYVKGNSSLNVKNDAFLAFAGMTRDDIEPVWFGGYGALKTAFLAGKLDAFMATTSSGHAREVEASSLGLDWIDMDPSDAEGWARVQVIAPMMAPAVGTNGVGMSEENPVNTVQYRTPMMVTYADRSEDEVYEITKALHETFDLYKGSHAAAHNWDITRSGHTPADVAWHPGSVKFLREMGVWTAEDEDWNQQRMARQTKVAEEWDNATDAFNQWRLAEKKAGNKVDIAEAWPVFWSEHRKSVGLE